MSVLVPWNICAICTYAHWAFPATIAWVPKNELMPAALDAKALESAPSEGGRTWGKQTKAWVVFDVAACFRVAHASEPVKRYEHLTGGGLCWWCASTTQIRPGAREISVRDGWKSGSALL